MRPNPAVRRERLLDLIRAEHDRLETLLAGLTPEQMDRPGVSEGWSVKDVMAHLTWWERQMLATMNGAPDIFNPAVEDWRDTIERVNRETYAANKDRPLAEVRTEFDATYQDVLAQVARLTDQQLCDEAVYTDIAGNTFQHFQEHRAAIEHWLSGQTRQ
jgi:uncharacterized protein (TIGR03083 family)